jgi:hypothetical protein
MLEFSKLLDGVSRGALQGHSKAFSVYVDGRQLQSLLVGPVWRDPVPVIAGEGRGGKSGAGGAGKPPGGKRMRHLSLMVALPGFGRAAGVAVALNRAVVGHWLGCSGSFWSACPCFSASSPSGYCCGLRSCGAASCCRALLLAAGH